MAEGAIADDGSFGGQLDHPRTAGGTLNSWDFDADIGPGSTHASIRRQSLRPSGQPGNRGLVAYASRSPDTRAPQLDHRQLRRQVHRGVCARQLTPGLARRRPPAARKPLRPFFTHHRATRSHAIEGLPGAVPASRANPRPTRTNSTIRRRAPRRPGACMEQALTKIIGRFRDGRLHNLHREREAPPRLDSFAEGPHREALAPRRPLPDAPNLP